MGSIRYQIDERSRRIEMAKLLYVSTSIYEGDWPSIRHTHYFSELFYVRSGRGKFIVENQSFQVQQDDLVIVNPNVEHTEVSTGADPLEYVVLGVEGLSFAFGDDPGSEDYTVHNYRGQRDELFFYFSTMLRETERREQSYAAVCQDLLEVLLINLLRHAADTFTVVPPQKASSECSRIKRYIDSSFAEEITLGSLAERSHLNKYYLVHTFTKYYGLSPISYLNEKRLQAGKELLESTDHSISQIAQLTGFSSQSYFSQSFKKACGMTPGDYRKRMRPAAQPLRPGT